MKARIKKTGQIIEVYKHSIRNTYVNAVDCTTEYTKDELDFLTK